MAAKKAHVMVTWKCPACGAKANKHGDGGQHECNDRHASAKGCNGFVCDCMDEALDDRTHGYTFDNPCENAVCHHCAWSGTFPVPPKSAAPWEKRALAAGWIPPRARAAELGLADDKVTP